MKKRLMLAVLLSAGVWLLAQQTIGPVSGLLVPVWDSLYEHYVYLKLPEFQALMPQTPGVPASTLQIATPLPGGVVGVPYKHALTAMGGTAPYTWAITEGELPTGLTLSADGVISGTPTVEDTKTFAVTVTDSSGATTLANFRI